MINRTIFIDKPSRLEYALDYILAIGIALSLTMGFLCYFDVL